MANKSVVADPPRSVSHLKTLLRMHVIPIILLASISSGCLKPECSNEVMRELPSPDGKAKIVLFSRNCGATTGFNTQTMILNIDEKMPDEPGNTFIVDTGEAEVTWKKEGGILVIFDHKVRISRQKTLVRGITIEYQYKND
jgi:hypothetical protein